MPNETLLDAINAAIPSGDAPEQEVEEEVVAGEEPAEEPVEGEEPAEGEEAAEEEPAEGEEGAEGEEDPEAAAAAAAKAAADAAKKPADPINDPLPKGTLQSTSERFKTVVGMLKNETTRADTLQAENTELRAQHDGLIGEITGAGMGGAEFGYMLEYASGVNSGTEEGLVKARSILMKELEAVSQALGEPMPGQSPLTGHADLIAEVNAKTLTPQRASEIAVQRNRDAARAKLGQVRQTQQQTAQHSQAEQTAGTQALTALGKELAAKDGQAEYVRKAKLVVSMLQEVMPSISPKKWATTFKAAYEKVPAAPKVPAKVAAPGSRPQPLRGNKAPAGAGAGTKAPKTLLEAMGPAFE